jgi:hypothetical protein
MIGVTLWACTARDRHLAGDDVLRPGVPRAGIPPCAVTVIDNLNPVMIASVSHLT